MFSLKAGWPWKSPHPSLGSPIAGAPSPTSGMPCSSWAPSLTFCLLLRSLRLSFHCGENLAVKAGLCSALGRVSSAEFLFQPPCELRERVRAKRACTLESPKFFLDTWTFQQARKSVCGPRNQFSKKLARCYFCAAKVENHSLGDLRERERRKGGSRKEIPEMNSQIWPKCL